MSETIDHSRNLNRALSANSRAAEHFSAVLKDLSEAASLMGQDRLGRTLDQLAMEIEAQAAHVLEIYRTGLFAEADANVAAMVGTINAALSRTKEG